MRNLTSVNSAKNVLVDLEIGITLSDQSTTFIFDLNDISDMSDLSQEIDFGGGFGKPSDISITMNSSVDFIKTYRKQLINSELYLKVMANSDTFTPFVGRVRDLTRFPENLNQFELRVYDRFLDSNPMIPRESMIDSYTDLHPSIIDVDMGYPLYYGKHTRPFYFTPVDCSINVLLGPRNVSSENHVTSLHHYINNYNISSNYYPMMFNKQWTQESSGNLTTTNILQSSYFWNISCGYLLSDDDYKTKSLFVFDGLTDENVLIGNVYVVPQYQGQFPSTNWSRNSGNYFQGLTYVGSAIASNAYSGQAIVAGAVIKSNPAYSFSYKAVHNISLSVDVSGYGDISAAGRNGFWVTLSILNNGTRFAGLLANKQPYYENSLYFLDLFPLSALALDTFEPETVDASQFFEEQTNYIGVGGVKSGYALTNSVTLTMCVDFKVELTNESYINPYQIFGIQVNCSDIAVSENPHGVVYDLVTNHSSFDINIAQNSQCQYECASYNFQCLFDKRTKLTNILDDFGKVTASYLWMGDSGYVNSRVYQESSTLTTSGLIDFTLTTTDFLLGTMSIKDNPLGTTVYQTQKAKKVVLKYGYDYSTDIYKAGMSASKLNNSFCDSAASSGVQDELTAESPYVLETFTVSLWMRNIVRKVTQNEQIVELKLPAQFFGVELCDVFKQEHPIYQNSFTVFQVSRIKTNYMSGQVTVTGVEILNT